MYLRQRESCLWLLNRLPIVQTSSTFIQNTVLLKKRRSMHLLINRVLCQRRGWIKSKTARGCSTVVERMSHDRKVMVFFLLSIPIIKCSYFFTPSMHIKLASPQAAQLNIHFSRKISSDAPLWGTWLRTHHCWIERDTEKEKRKKPSTQRDLNPWLLCHEACALLLCYNHCPNCS